MKVPELMSHEQAIELLPWLLNDSLDDSELTAVQDHARSCVVCRRELDSLKKLRRVVVDDAAGETIPVPDMRNINARIDQLIEKQSWKDRVLSWARTHLASPWKVALVVQTGLVIGLAAALMWPSTPEPEFTTLTQAETFAGDHHIRVVFSPETTLAEVTTILEDLALTVVNGPTSQGVYTLAFANGLSPKDREQLLGQLQNTPFVQFAHKAVHYNPEDQ